MYYRCASLSSRKISQLWCAFRCTPFRNKERINETFISSWIITQSNTSRCFLLIISYFKTCHLRAKLPLSRFLQVKHRLSPASVEEPSFDQKIEKARAFQRWRSGQEHSTSTANFIFITCTHLEPTPGSVVISTNCVPSAIPPEVWAGHDPAGLSGDDCPNGIVPLAPTATPPTNVSGSTPAN